MTSLSLVAAKAACVVGGTALVCNGVVDLYYHIRARQIVTKLERTNDDEVIELFRLFTQHVLSDAKNGSLSKDMAIVFVYNMWEQNPYMWAEKVERRIEREKERAVMRKNEELTEHEKQRAVMREIEEHTERDIQSYIAREQQKEQTERA